MNKLRTLIYTVLDGVETRVENFLVQIENAFTHTVNRLFDLVQTTVQQGVSIVFGLIETVVEEGFGLVNAVVELVIGKRDTNILSLPTEVVMGEYGVFELDDQTPTEVAKEDN